MTVLACFAIVAAIGGAIGGLILFVVGVRKLCGWLRQEWRSKRP